MRSAACERRSFGAIAERPLTVAPHTDAPASLRGPFWLAGGAVAVFAWFIGGQLLGEMGVRYVDDVATAAAALVAALLCARTALGAGHLRAFWFLLAAACGAWALGELIWGLYDLVLGTEVPVPSWADAAYLAAIPFAAAALVAHPALRGRALGKSRSVLDALVTAAALFFLSWTLVLEPHRSSFDLGSLGGAVAAAYPLGDIAILFLVLLVIRGATGGDRLEVWCLLGGLLLITLSDAIYGYLSEVTRYATGNWIDAGWFAGYLAIALGAHVARLRPASRPQEVEEPRLSSAAVIGPFVPLFAALVLAAARTEVGHGLDGVALATAFLLVALFLVRQSLLMVDLLGPGHHPDAELPDRLLAAHGRPTAARRVDPSRPPPAAAP
jgi:hypothetical protein